MGCVSSRTTDYDEIIYPLVKARTSSQSTILHSNSPPVVQTEMAESSVGVRCKNPEIHLDPPSPSMEDVSMSLEDFVTYFSLPQRAKVIGGYWEAEDETDSSREFAADEILHLTQVVCPFVNLLAADPDSGITIRVSLSTRFQNAKFRVISHRELTRSTKPRVFKSVEEMVKVFPHTVKALSAHKNGTEEGLFSNGDRLRLVRIASLPEGKRVLECKLLRGSMRLLQLPLNYQGNFAEVDDPKGYTLYDLVNIARVPRTLKMCQAPSDETPALVPGIPVNFDGCITLERPQLFVRIQRVQRADVVDLEPDVGVNEKPFLVPIDCPIDISLREDTYEASDFSNLKLEGLVRKYTSSMPFVARVTDWTEETSILQQHLVRPGTQLVFIREETRANVLVREKARNRHFLIPVDHIGSFVRLNNIREDCGLSRINPLDLKSMEDASFPFDVKFTNEDNPYSNLPDGVLPLDSTLTFEAYVEEDNTAVVAKLSGGIICKYFHLPIRTGLRLQFERRLPNAQTNAFDHRWSEQDSLAEEINGKVYNELMQLYSDYEWFQADENSYSALKPVTLTHQRLSSDLKTTHQKSNPDFEMSADGYLKPSPQPPTLRPRVKGDGARKSPILGGHSPTSRRRNVPPPPTAPRDSAPPVPSRSSRFSYLSMPENDRTDSPTPGKTKAPLPHPPPPHPPHLPHPPHPPHPHPQLLLLQTDSNDDDDSESSLDSDGQSYSYIDVETLEDCVQYRQKAFPGNVATDGVSIPSDGNVSNFTAEQMLLFLREVHAPVGTINAWRQLRINGQDFAKMTDKRLEEYRIPSIVVQFFRDRSRMHVLSQL